MTRQVTLPFCAAVERENWKRLCAFAVRVSAVLQPLVGTMGDREGLARCREEILQIIAEESVANKVPCCGRIDINLKVKGIHLGISCYALRENTWVEIPMEEVMQMIGVVT